MNNPAKAVVLPERVVPAHPDYDFAQYTPAQAAAYLHISRNVFYQLVAGGKVAFERATKRTIVCSQRHLDTYRATRLHPVAGPEGLRLASSNVDRPSKKSRYA